MRYLIGFICVLALGVVPVAGCSDAEGGEGGFPCTEQGIVDAIAEGGGPHAFACDGPTEVVTTDTIDLSNDVVLDGEGNLTVVGDHANAVFESGDAELIGFVVIGEGVEVIRNHGTLTLTDCRVSGGDIGIRTFQWAEVKLANSTVSGNGFGIWNNAGTGPSGSALMNSTVSGNTEGGIVSGGEVELTNSTVSGNAGLGIDNDRGILIAANSLIDGGCSGDGDFYSYGYNIESEGDACGLDQPTDQVNVSADDLKLGPLQDNGGPTETHALLPGSVALDQIPAGDCEVDTDQRGEPRPETGGTLCDVGAFEVQP